MYGVTLAMDTSIAEQHMHELIQLLESRFPKGIPRQILSDLKSLSLDVVLSNNGSTLLADGTVKVLQRLRFGREFEIFRAALYAGEIDHARILHESERQNQARC